MAAAAPGCDHALNWHETERANLVAATCHAAQAGQPTIAWRLPVTLAGLFMQPFIQQPDSVAACRAALTAAQIDGQHAQA